MKLVDHYAKIENRYKMYENLEKAVSCSKKADNQPDYQVNYTATLIRYAKYDSRCDFNCNKSYSDNLVKHILECPEFDLYRNDLKLKKLLAELK